MKHFLFLLAFLATQAHAAERVIINPDSNGDLKLKVNVGGTVRDAISVNGATNIITFGDAGIAASPVFTGSGTMALTISPAAGNPRIDFQQSSSTKWELEGTTSSFIVAKDASRQDLVINYSSGAWTVGSTSGTNTTHTINGGTVSADTGTVTIQAAGSSKFGLNLYSTTGADQRGFFYADNSGTAYLGEKGGGGLKFYSGGLAGTNVGLYNGSGAWTLGPASSGNINHTVQSGGVTTFVINAGGTNLQRLYFNNGATTNWEIDSANAGSLTIYQGGSTAVGSVTVAGAWTLGPSGSTAAHQINGDILQGTSNSRFRQSAPGLPAWGIVKTYDVTISGGTTSQWTMPSGFLGHIYVRANGNVGGAFVIATDGNCLAFSGPTLVVGSATLNRISNCSYTVSGLSGTNAGITIVGAHI